MFYIGPALQLTLGSALPFLITKYTENITLTKAALLKTGAYQLLFAPLLYGGFMICHKILHAGYKNGEDKLDIDTMFLLKNHLKGFPPSVALVGTNFLMFRFVPVRHQVIFACFAGVLLNNRDEYESGPISKQMYLDSFTGGGLGG